MPTSAVPAIALVWAIATTIIGIGLRLWQLALEERLTREMEKLASKAKHDAIDEVTPLLGKLVTKDAYDGMRELYDTKIDNLTRRVDVCEEGAKHR